MGDTSGDTSGRTLVRTEANAAGYRRLRTGPGEQHVVRADLVGDRDPEPGPFQRVVELLHLTDIQLADLASPSRVEFLQRLAGRPEWQRMLPAVRPQEFLLEHAVESIVQTVRRAVVDGTIDPDLVISTGDNTDSAQLDEVHRYLTLLDGGPVEPCAGADFAATPTGSGDPAYWTPDPAVDDDWTRERGFPTDAVVVPAAREPFTATGLGLPWLTCFGNHDCLVQGRATPPASYDAFLAGARKPVALAPGDEPTGRGPDDALAAYGVDPLRWSHGPTVEVHENRERRLVDRAGWVGAHLASSGDPTGHGFGEHNLADGTTWYHHDEVPGVRVIGLDTTNPDGGVDGCLGQDQLTWLTQRLTDVHSEHRDARGQTVRTGGTDRLVVLLSHHGLSTLHNGVNRTGWTASTHLAPEVEALLHRFDNVVLWLSGHTHVNRVTPRPGAGGGFWEISTGALAEWPVQVRSLRLDVAGEVLRVRSTMLDSDAPASPEPGGTTLADLAALHREVAGNDDGSVGGLEAQGEPLDRNVDLLVLLRPTTASALVGA